MRAKTDDWSFIMSSDTYVRTPKTDSSVSNVQNVQATVNDWWQSSEQQAVVQFNIYTCSLCINIFI
jgi:hypothetical protein